MSSYIDAVLPPPVSVMHMSEQLQSAPMSPVPAAHWIMAQDQVCVAIPDFRDVMYRMPAQVAIPLGIVIAFDQVLSAWNTAQQVFHKAFCGHRTANTYIPKDPKIIMFPNHRFKSLNVAGVHLLDRLEGSIADCQDVGVTQVQVGSVPIDHDSFLEKRAFPAVRIYYTTTKWVFIRSGGCADQVG